MQSYNTADEGYPLENAQCNIGPAEGMPADAPGIQVTKIFHPYFEDKVMYSIEGGYLTLDNISSNIISGSYERKNDGSCVLSFYLGEGTIGDRKIKSGTLGASDVGLGNSLLCSKSTIQLVGAPQVQASAYGNGIIVILKFYTGSVTAQYSKDGFHWEAGSGISNIYYSDLCYGNGKFVAKQNYGGGGAYSEDGINWEANQFPSDMGQSVLAYGNGMFVAIDLDGGTSYHSTDGKSWIAGSSIGGRSLSKMAYGNGAFIVVQGNPSSSGKYNILYRSTNGRSWSSYTLPATLAWTNVIYGNGTWVAIARDSNIAAYSENGTSWMQSQLPVSATWTQLAYGNGRFVAVGENNAIAYSDDGKTWIPTSLPANWKGSNSSPNMMVHDGKKFVLFSYKGDYEVYYSLDGITWSYEFADLSLPDGTNVTSLVAQTINGI